MPDPSLFDRPLLVVSGKGGTGKTTIAAACAAAAANAGRRTLLVEAEGRNGVPSLLGVPGPGFRETPTPLGFSILSVDPRDALIEYLWLFYRVRTLARPLRKARVIDLATETVPGFRDLMLAGKLYELAEWRKRSPQGAARPQYDLVVLDAPPTGQLVPLLRSASAFGELLRAGRSNRHLVAIDAMLRTSCRVALVATPEEMPVEETAETVAELEEHGFDAPVIVANQVLGAPFPRGTRSAAAALTARRLAEVAAAAGVSLSAMQGQSLLDAAFHQDARHRAQRPHLKRLRVLAHAVEVPFLFSERFGPAEIAAVAEAISGGGAASAAAAS